MIQFQRSGEAHNNLPQPGKHTTVPTRRKSNGRIDIHLLALNISLASGLSIVLRPGLLSRQLGSALGTTACKNFPAVGSCHSLSEPMHFGSVALFGLIGTQHCIHLLKKYAQQLSPAAASPVKYPVIGWGHTVSIITAVCGLVNHFFKKYEFFAGFSGNHKIWGCTC